jgi:uncharacterized protein YprB with RNaseH-like and TPR domain
MTSEPESTFDKLKSLGVQIGAQHLKPPAPKPASRPQHGIENVVDGDDEESEFGLCFVARQDFSSDHQHGCLGLCTQPELDVISTWGSTPQLNDPSLGNVVFLDTETSGLMGGAGTYAFLVGVGYHSADGFHLLQFFMRDPAQEPALLAALAELLSRFKVVVTFNGKTFDVPLLLSRYTMNGMRSPFDDYDHLDVLQIARKLWRDRLPSRALGELEKEIGRFYRTGEEVPGWMVPQLYFDYLKSGDARPLGGVFYHNAMDLLSLAALFNYVAALVKEPVRHAQSAGFDLAAIARLYEEMGWLEQAADLYGASMEQGLPEPFYLKTIERYALLRRKQGEWDKAVLLWQKAADQGQYLACVELAKYYEHRGRNYREALIWTQRALALLDRFFTYESTRRPVELELRQRVQRLTRKLLSE